MQIVAFDQIFGSTRSSKIVIDWQEDVPVTLRFLIEERVRLYWESKENAAPFEPYAAPDHSGLPAQQPSFYKPPTARPTLGSCRQTIDEAIAEALQSFEANGFFVIVDGKQVCNLDTPLRLSPKSEVRFLRLVPLVGG